MRNLIDSSIFLFSLPQSWGGSNTVFVSLRAPSFGAKQSFSSEDCFVANVGLLAMTQKRFPNVHLTQPNRGERVREGGIFWLTFHLMSYGVARACGNFNLNCSSMLSCRLLILFFRLSFRLGTCPLNFSLNFPTENSGQYCPVLPRLLLLLQRQNFD